MRRVLRALLDAPLAVHAGALAVVLIALVPVIGSSGQFSADEGAAIAQARQLERGAGWTINHPFPAADPDGTAFPFEQSNRGGDGYAPFAKHPVYPALLSVADRALGRPGMLLLSIFGTVAAAVLSATLARRLDRALAVPTLWLIGIGSPLFFDSYTVIAHSIGAACVAFAVWCVVRAHDNGARWWPVAIVVATGAAMMLRTEVLFFALALSVAAIVRQRRGVTAWIVAAAPTVGAALGFGLDRVLLKVVVPGPASTTPWLSSPSEGFLAGRFSAVKTTLLLSSYDLKPGDTLLAVAVVFGAVAVWLARTKPSERDGVRLFSMVAIALALAWLVAGAGPVPGLLPAFPLLVFAIVAWDRQRLPEVGRFFVMTFVLFAAAVTLTEYASGGSGEWGGRYFAIGLPVIAPVVLWIVVRWVRALDRSTAVLATAGFVVLCLVLSLQAVITLRQFHGDVDTLVRGIDAAASANAASDGGLPVVLTSDGAAGRFAFTVVEHTRWLTVTADRLDEYARRLRDLHVGTITFVTRSKDDLKKFADAYRSTGEVDPLPGWVVATLQPT